jgi:hypothetical protein
MRGMAGMQRSSPVADMYRCIEGGSSSSGRAQMPDIAGRSLSTHVLSSFLRSTDDDQHACRTSRSSRVLDLVFGLVVSSSHRRAESLSVRFSRLTSYYCTPKLQAPPSC